MTDPLPLHCAEVLDLLTELLEDALSATDRLLVEAHLAGCEDCRIRREQLRVTIELIGRAGRRVL
ncbi:zf-HC2 domain-containing protein [Brachybacterium sp. YJGR34]|uniref:zf-HC2 domain-containing protein n=1 Tax=Brachybacterium sp. YJGR34 TaxID=2059911 RepID=UPI000E0C598B|nr:zf-HC2 domain-containing protein [Brachybacterium sp. YJGR34]